MRRSLISRLLVADGELVDRLAPETLQSLRSRRNLSKRRDLKFLSIRLNDDDFATPSAKYTELLDWLRRLAISGCRSAAARWSDEKASFLSLKRQFATGVPPIHSAGVGPPDGVDERAFLDALVRAPEHRPIVGDVSFVDLAESMRAVEWRRQRAELRETTGLA